MLIDQASSGTEGDVWGVAIWKLVSARFPNLMKNGSRRDAMRREYAERTDRLLENMPQILHQLDDGLNCLRLCCSRICGWCCKVDEVSIERAITKKRKRAHRSHTKKANSGGHHKDLEVGDQQRTETNSTLVLTLECSEGENETENALDFTNPKVSYTVDNDRQQTQPELNPLPEISHVNAEEVLAIPTSKQLPAKCAAPFGNVVSPGDASGVSDKSSDSEPRVKAEQQQPVGGSKKVKMGQHAKSKKARPLSMTCEFG